MGGAAVVPSVPLLPGQVVTLTALVDDLEASVGDLASVQWDDGGYVELGLCALEATAGTGLACSVEWTAPTTNGYEGFRAGYTDARGVTAYQL